MPNLKHQMSNKHEVPSTKCQTSTKFQAPNPKQASNSKQEISNKCVTGGVCGLEFDNWDLFGIWDLRFWMCLRFGV